MDAVLSYRTARVPLLAMPFLGGGADDVDHTTVAYSPVDLAQETLEKTVFSEASSSKRKKKTRRKKLPKLCGSCWSSNAVGTTDGGGLFTQAYLFL